MIKRYPKVTIITVNFNGKKYLKRLFDSVFRLNYPKDKLEVILVDNVSSDNSAEFAKKIYPKVKIIRNDVNNYCKAVNLGIGACKGEFVGLINNDTRLHKDWLIELIKVISRDKTIAAAGSKILDMSGRIQNAAHYELPDFYWGERGSGEEKKNYSALEEVPSLCGASVLYRKGCFDKTGLFDEDFMMYGEDTDMALRLRNKGWKLVFVPRSLIYHTFHGTASEDLSRFYIERNRLLFIAKHYPDKLSAALVGSGYFTAEKSADSCGKIYSILPQIILKLVKHHNIGFVSGVLSEICEALKKVAYYENDILAKLINNVTDEKNKFQDELKQLDLKLKEYTEESLSKDNQIADKDIELTYKDKEIERVAQDKDKELERLKQDKDKEIERVAQDKDKELERLKQDKDKELDTISQDLKDSRNYLAIEKNLNSERKIQLLKLQLEFNEINNKFSQALQIVSDKDAKLSERDKEFSALQEKFRDLSEEFDTCAKELLMKGGQVIEGRAEIGALKGELSRLAEDLAATQIVTEENRNKLTATESELRSLKNELDNISGQLKSRSDEILIKEGQIIEKDIRILSLEDEFDNISGQLKSRSDELTLKESQIIEKDDYISFLKNELNNISGQLKSRSDEVILNESQISSLLKSILDDLTNRIRQKTEEISLKENQCNAYAGEITKLRNRLNGIYNSEGYRFILRPLWTIIWNTRDFIKISGSKLNRFFWLSLGFIMTPVFILVSVCFLFEHISWVVFKPLLKFTSRKRKYVPFEDIKEAKVSIVIPNYNGIELLRECLCSVFAADGFSEGQNEVLVVDDGSTDSSVDFITRNFPGVRLLRNKRNRGFGFTCTRGIKAAKNDIIVLINNDIILTKDFLRPLLGHLRRHDVFAVTPKLYGWDRKTFVWGMHMGHFEHGHVRLWNESETGNGDKINNASPSIFAIGGAMVFRKADFFWLGGFDEIYRPNCWEDIDLSYRAWKRGLKVIYEPASLMYHKGRATLTYERPKEIKNELLFTWRNITDGRILKNHLNLLPWNLCKYRLAFLRGFLWALDYLPQALLHRFLERRFMAETQDSRIFNRITLFHQNFAIRGFKQSYGDRPNILLISRFLPYPLNNGGKIRIHSLVKALSDKYNFILLSLIDHEDELRYIPKLKELFGDVYPVLAKSPLNLSFSSQPFYPDLYKIAYSYSQELADKLWEIQDKIPIDIIHIESNELLYLTDYIKYAPVVYTEHDASILFPRSSYYKKNGSLIWSVFDFLKRVNFHIWRVKRIDKIITLAKKDESALRTFFPGADINLLPTCVDLKHFSFKSSLQRSRKLIFVGHYRHYPNEDAIVYFVKKIFPLIRKKMPDVQLLIVGSGPTQKVEKLSRNKNVILIGEVNDVKPYLDDAAVFVNSLRISAGIKGKVLEAMSCGVPVVSTQVGSSGIDARPEKEILIGNNPWEFASQVIRVLNDDGLRMSLINNARRLVEDKYDWRKIADKLDTLYKSLLSDSGYDNMDFSATDRIIEKVKDFVERKIEQTNGDLNNPERGPEELHIELTYNCNSKCIMCDLWDYNKRLRRADCPELSLDEIKQFVGESRFLQRPKTVVLSGGEPFLRDDLVNLCGFFVKQLPDSSIGILTNGVDTEAIITKTKEVLNRFQPKSLWLGSSLDGIGKEHDKIRGNEGAFSAFCETVNRCKRELPGVKLSATFTLTPYNIDQLIPAKRFADNEGLGFFAQFVVPKEARGEFTWTPQNLELAEKEIKQIIRGIIGKSDQQLLLDSIDKVEDKNLISQLYYWSHLFRYQINPQRFFKKCISGSKFAMFNPYGDLFFCPTHKNSFIGNVRKESFDSLWNSDKAQHMRSFIKDGNCHCWLVCIVFPVLEKALSN